MVSTARPFLQIAIAAFPPCCRTPVEGAAKALMPFIDDGYRQPSVEAVVFGRTVRIPKRIHLLGLDAENLESQYNFGPETLCLCTRSTDGYIRQASLRHILGNNEPWIIPFVTLLAAEYVVEIIEDMVTSLSALDRDAYINFVRENRPMMRRLRSQAASYWKCNYRSRYSDRSTYPGLAFLHQLELWAS